MASSDERLKILTLIQQGKLSPEEGLRLLDALNKPAGVKSTPPAAGTARWMRVLITDTVSGKTRVNVRLPVTMLNTGIKMGARFSTDLGQQEMDHIKEAIRSGATGKVLDVIDEEDSEHIEVMLE